MFQIYEVCGGKQMNNENLPQVVKENIFFKIKRLIKGLIKKNEKKIVEPKVVQSNKQEEKSFTETLKVEDLTKILNLQKELKENKIKIEELTDNQLQQMIDLYKKQIEQKKLKLKQYRQIINMKRTLK